jgi:hypothetical protein
VSADARVATALLHHIVEHRGVGRLAELLSKIKASAGLPRDAFRATGNREQLHTAMLKALETAHVTVGQLAALVDAIEDNGGQHVFLFSLTSQGRRELTSAALSAQFQTRPAPSEALYAPLPSSRRTYFHQDGPVGVLKQTATETFWEKQDTEEDDNVRRVTYTRESSRAVNLLLVDTGKGVAEIRIDKVRGATDEKLCGNYLTNFLDGLHGRVRIGDHVVPVPVWNGYGAIAGNRAETFMAVDDAFDPVVNAKIASRREGTTGKDVRDHRLYRFDSSFTRRFLTVYWRIPDSETLVHTLISRLSWNGTDLGKVYVPAKCSSAELTYVLGRIREFSS